MKQHRSRSAVVVDGRHRTYADLDDRACRLANGLAGIGLGPGDRVALLLENQLEYPEIDVGLAYGGFVRVALNARLAREDHEYVLVDCSARALISDQRFDELIGPTAESIAAPWLRIGEKPLDATAIDYEIFLAQQSASFPVLGDLSNAPAWISYTSGTTGRPKGVVLSHRALAHTAFNLMLEVGPRVDEERILLPQPLSHGSGYLVLAYLASGATVYPMQRFDPEEALWLGARDGIQTLKLVPTMLASLLEIERPSPFQLIVYGASPIALPQLEKAMSYYGPILMQVYGQSEAPMAITCLREHDHARPGPHLASAGRAWRSVEVRVVDDGLNTVPPHELGQVAVRGEHLMTGYLGKPELTGEVLRDGWLLTRDLGVADDDGYFYLRGRSDDMIISGGFNIAPREVEDVLVTHAGVDACAVIGVPDERWGQAVRAYVRLGRGAAATEEELLAFAGSRLGYRRPRSVVFVDELPHTSYGKLDRRQLERLAEGPAAPASEELA